MRVETVTIIDKDHPAGRKDINKSDLKEGDVIFKEPEKKIVKKKDKKGGK